MNSPIRHLLPFGLVRALQFRQKLLRLGIGRSKSAKLAMTSAAPAWLTKSNLDLFPAHSLHSVATVVDVGANRGDWTGMVLRFCEPVAVICFEPDPRLASALDSRFCGDARVKVIHAAVGAEDSVADLNLAQKPVYNSLLPTSSQMPTLSPGGYETTGSVQVPVHPIDSYTQHCERISIIKIDVQGYEKHVIAGATKSLAKTDFVLLEVNFKTHYEGEATFFDLDELMRGHGFCIGNYSRPYIERLHALWTDVLYVRANA